MVGEKDRGELRSVSECTRDRASGRPQLLLQDSRPPASAASEGRAPRAARGEFARDVAVPDGHRRCPDCSTVKPLDEFVRNAGQASGRNPYCTPCHNVRGKASKDKVGGARTCHLTRRYGITAMASPLRKPTRCRKSSADSAPYARRLPPHMSTTRPARSGRCWASPLQQGTRAVKDDPSLVPAAAHYVSFHTARHAAAAELGATSTPQNTAGRLRNASRGGGLASTGPGRSRLSVEQ
jgi:hypothetical protein